MRESEVAHSCLTLSDPMDCNLPGSSIHGICQARVLEWYYSTIKKQTIDIMYQLRWISRALCLMEKVSESYMLYDSTYITFSEWQSNENGEQISDCGRRWVWLQWGIQKESLCGEGIVLCPDMAVVTQFYSGDLNFIELRVLINTHTHVHTQLSRRQKVNVKWRL